MQSISSLNKRYAIESLSFKRGENGFVYADINNTHASAQIYLHGAQVTSFVPTDHEPVIFLSSESLYQSGKAIRGGIPISWPWFADHPEDKSKPAHGFARTCLWEVKATEQLISGNTQISLALRDSKQTHDIWDYCFELELTISVGRELKAVLNMNNSGRDKFFVTSAFHSYYHVGNISEITIHGLEGAKYIDKVDNFVVKEQDGPVTILDETDRIYQHTKTNCIIEDRSLSRRIEISKSGSNSTVLWNPWREKARAMGDLSDLDYTKFVCVETTNAAQDIIEIAPNGKHSLEVVISVENLK